MVLVPSFDESLRGLPQPYRSPKPTPSPPRHPELLQVEGATMMDEDDSTKHEQLHAVNAAAQLYHAQLAQQQQLQQLQHAQSLGASVVAQQLSAASASFPYPRNSPDFACENVGDRIKGKRRKYCPHEVTALVLGVQRYADDSCPWSSILRDPHLGPLFHGRSGVDLKDKWRTLIKTRPELSSYTENRKNHRKYRPFTTMEERALIDGVKKYNGQRNVWSLILVDKDLGVQFNDRSNVQLKDKFRTLRRSGVANAITLTNPSNRKSALTTTSGLRPGGGGAGTSKNNVLRGPLSPKSRTQLNAAALANPILHSQSMFTDPNLFMTAQLSLGQIGQLTLAQAQVQAQLQAQTQAAQAKTFSQMLAAANSSYNNALPAFMMSGGNTSPQSNVFYAVSSPSSATVAATAVPFQATKAQGNRGVASTSGRLGRPSTASAGTGAGGRRGRGKAKATSASMSTQVLDTTPSLENAPLSPPLEGLIPMPAAVRGKLDDAEGWDPIDDDDDEENEEGS